MNSLSLFIFNFNFYKQTQFWIQVPLSVGGYSQASQAHKALSSTFYCGGEFIWRLIQDYRPFVARSSPQKVDIKIIKTCPKPRTQGLLPSSTEIAQNTATEQRYNQTKQNQTLRIKKKTWEKYIKEWVYFQIRQLTIKLCKNYQ